MLDNVRREPISVFLLLFGLGWQESFTTGIKQDVFKPLCHARGSQLCELVKRWEVRMFGKVTVKNTIILVMWKSKLKYITKMGLNFNLLKNDKSLSHWDTIF